jgi:hypothetical protein
MIDALRFLGVSRLALATPYPEEVSASEARFLDANGFAVVSHACLGRSGAAVRPSSSSAAPISGRSKSSISSSKSCQSPS